MAVREIVCYPDDMLRRKCNKVKNVNDDVRRLMDDMAETMYSARGVGLAAPQIGVPRRVIVVHAHQDQEDEGTLYGVVNPVILEKSSGKELGEEGCLSIPGVRGEVLRSTSVVVEGLDYEGEPLRLALSGFEARVFQHEVDHLRGVLFIDYMDSLTREVALKEYLEEREALAGKGN